MASTGLAREGKLLPVRPTNAAASAGNSSRMLPGRTDAPGEVPPRGPPRCGTIPPLTPEPLPGAPPIRLAAWCCISSDAPAPSLLCGGVLPYTGDPYPGGGAKRDDPLPNPATPVEPSSRPASSPTPGGVGDAMLDGLYARLVDADVAGAWLCAPRLAEKGPPAAAEAAAPQTLLPGSWEPVTMPARVVPLLLRLLAKLLASPGA
jgi:hypothetical protein